MLPENCTLATCVHSCVHVPTIQYQLCIDKKVFPSQTNLKMANQHAPAIRDLCNRQHFYCYNTLDDDQM